MNLAEKKIKAFDIIKDKEVEVPYVKAFKKYKTYKEHTFINVLTEEEFDLLKEML